MKNLTNIKYIGVNDHQIDLFEGQYPVPNGMSYNSYAVIDEKIAIFDTVDKNFGDEWLANVKNALDGKSPDYLIVQHMEPDHSANIHNFISEYPDAKIVASQKAFDIMKNFFGTDYADNRIVVKEGDTLSLGSRTLTFITAPMVHWPEVIVTYDDLDKVLFSADAFGKFGALDIDEDWACEARRYYFGIVGKFGAQAQALLKKAAGLEVKAILPLHGPQLFDNLGYYLDLYNTWTTYQPETEGVTIAYTSVYGNTKNAVSILENMLKEKGVKVSVFDLARDDMSEAVEDAFKYSKLVLATTTYNGGIFPFMDTFLTHLAEHSYQNRTVAFIENGSWAPVAAKNMMAKLEKCKNMITCENTVKILSAVDDENMKQLEALANELA